MPALPDCILPASGGAAPKGWSELHGDAGILLMLSSSMPLQSSGYAVRSHAIASSLIRHGARVTACTKPGYPLNSWSPPKPFASPAQVEDVAYHRLPLYPVGMGEFGPAYRAQAANIIAAAAKAHRASIIHAASDMETGLPAMLAARQAGLKGIYEYRGMWHYSQAARNTWFPWTEPFQRRQRLELEAGQRADAVFAISEALKADLVAHGLPEDKITVLPNAVDASRFQPLPPDPELIDKYGLKGRVVIGFIGSFTYYEGLEGLIDATLELNWHGLPATLMLVGDGGDYGRHLRRHHEARGAHPAIIFTGRVPYEDVQRHYSVMDVMAFPRIPAKVSQCVPPLKPMEAMAMRKAVVVSDCAALKEMVDDGSTGLVCKAGDLPDLAGTLKRLVESAELRERLAQAGHEWVLANRDWAKVSERILTVYEKLLES